MSAFASPGDTVLNTSSDYSLLSVHAVRRASGAISVLVVNKSKTSALDGQITLGGFVPAVAGTLWSYGIPQDEATRTNAAFALQDIATNSVSGIASNFTQSFPPLSMSVFTLAPNAPSLTVFRQGGSASYAVQLSGQKNVRYFVQSSTNLVNWTTVATNTLTSTSTNLPITINTPQRYWRAVWQP
jgi:hypothetical protein